MQTLARDLESAFKSVGMSMMTDDFAAKILAYCYVIGDENCVLHKGLNAGLMIAQGKFNIKGGEVPDIQGIMLFRKYAKELEDCMKPKDGKSGYNYDFTSLPWIKEIYDRYDMYDKYHTQNKTSKSKK